MKLYVDKKKKKYIEATLVCKLCNRSFPEDVMEEHVKNCRGDQEGYA
jgi:uncharacterized protein YbaR (Trm112 family)